LPNHPYPHAERQGSSKSKDREYDIGQFPAWGIEGKKICFDKNKDWGRKIRCLCVYQYGINMEHQT